MTSEMFHAKHRPTMGKQGSNRGQGAASGGLTAAATAVLCAVLAACSSPEQIAEKTGVIAKATAQSGSQTATASASGADSAAFEDNAEQDGGSREFAYAWPAQVSAIPALAARLTTERSTILAEQKAEWLEAIAEFAGEDCAACTSRDFSKEWKVVADLPRYLSLSADTYTYTGGAHGNAAFDALVWDRTTGAAIDPKAMFRSEEDMQAALRDPWCKALKAERTKRLGADYADDAIFPCPDIAQLTVLMGSSHKKTFNRIGLIAAPYVAGSYAEGPYEVTLPVTPAVLAAIKPEYKAAFSLTK